MSKSVFRHSGLLLVVAVFVLAPACLEAAAEQSVVLTIGRDAAAEGETVQVPVYMSGGANPSTVLFNISYDATALEFIDATEGEQADLADKDLTVTQSEGLLRLGLLGGTRAISNGTLCYISFEVITESGGIVALTGWETSAASASGTSIPASIQSGEVVINCGDTALDAPANVTASTGAVAGVTVSWSPVAGAVEYQVYRAPKHAPEQVVAVSEWLTDTTWLDTTAAQPPVISPPAPATACNGFPQTPMHTPYYYWVRARGTEGCPSGYSEPAEGWRGAVKAVGVAAGAPGAAPADAAVLATVLLFLLAPATAAKAAAKFGRKNGAV